MNIKTVDQYFSLYIRLRDADRNGYCKCCTCGKMKAWDNVDCGHFMTRDNQATRFHVKNCSPQCAACNRFKGGKQYQHGRYIDKRYGEGTAELLMIASRSICKRTKFELKALGDHFRKEYKRIKKEKGL